MVAGAGVEPAVAATRAARLWWFLQDPLVFAGGESVFPPYAPAPLRYTSATPPTRSRVGPKKGESRTPSSTAFVMLAGAGVEPAVAATRAARLWWFLQDPLVFAGGESVFPPYAPAPLRYTSATPPTRSRVGPKKGESRTPSSTAFVMVAGAGVEPATSRL